MSKSLLIYEQPVVLDRTAHRRLRLKSVPRDFGFARQINSIPIAGVEFSTVASCYPIVFAGMSGQDLVAAALLGLRADENLFVGANGEWTADYVPAFARRYPFVLADKPDNGFNVCIDTSYIGFDENEGEPLFDDNGAEQPVLQQAITFLREFQGHLERTRGFVERVAQLDLFKPQVVKVVPPKGGEPRVLRDFQVIDEKRLLAINDADLHTLFHQGDLGWIYAHLISLSRISVLQQLLDRRLATEKHPPAPKRKRRSPARKKAATADT